MNNKLLKKFADLAVKVGVNIQKGQILVVNSPVECIELTRLIVESGYQAGASFVMVRYNDDIVSKTLFTYATMEVLTEVPQYIIEQHKYIVDNKAAVISISAPTPGLMKDIEPLKMQAATKAANEKIGFYRKHMMSNGSQWLVIAAPTLAWATKVFPNEDPNKVVDKLWEAILSASRVTEENDPVADWQNHIKRLAKRNQMLNNYNFKTLEFKNSLGTELSVELVENHIWGGGGEMAQTGVYFAPNIPTEETFTMPHSHRVNGKVVATMPLNYQGKLIEDFYLIFKDGKVVDYDAKKEKEALKSLLELDEGSSRLGEVALISYDSPISNTKILFYNTLFDENASCHLALGNAYTMNIKNGNDLSEEELLAKGYNKSITHVDFMFGSKDMNIFGIKQDGSKVQVFKDGNFVF
ncbi:MAG TPA: aminopeptidase [Bacilli bacterium]|nr:aminopeptidase [Bacilli bacterium]HPL55851.1 aminopeptidase [Bacilli bacterium]